MAEYRGAWHAVVHVSHNLATEKQQQQNTLRFCVLCMFLSASIVSQGF